MDAHGRRRWTLEQEISVPTSDPPAFYFASATQCPASHRLFPSAGTSGLICVSGQFSRAPQGSNIEADKSPEDGKTVRDVGIPDRIAAVPRLQPFHPSPPLMVRVRVWAIIQMTGGRISVEAVQLLENFHRPQRKACPYLRTPGGCSTSLTHSAIAFI